MTKPEKSSIKRNDVIAVGVKEPISYTGSFAGWVDAVDDKGILVDLMDYFIGQPSGRRLFIPWDNIHSYESCAEGNEEYFFSGYAQTFQTLHNDYIRKKFDIDEEQVRELRIQARG